MMTSTRFIARLSGLFTVTVAGLMLLDRRAGLERIDEVVASRPLSFDYGLIALGLGLAVVVGHNVWRGGVLPVAVTLLGWLMVAKGVLLIWAGSAELARFAAEYHSGPVYYAGLTAVLMFGLYLAAAGFRRSGGVSDRA